LANIYINYVTRNFIAFKSFGLFIFARGWD